MLVSLFCIQKMHGTAILKVAKIRQEKKSVVDKYWKTYTESC
jgi:hypothetical protein